MSDYNPGDTLTISAKSYPDGRRFKVVEANGHRTVLRGAKGAHRVLVCAPDQFGGECSLREDDGERNRGRPCVVDRIERAESDARTSPAEPFTISQSLTEMITAPPAVESLLARNRRTTPVAAQPQESRAVARARMLETEWGIVSTNNREAACEALADAMVKLFAGDVGGAREAAESAVRRLSNAKAFEYVARCEARRSADGETE